VNSELENKVAVVLGVSNHQGIGYAIAHQLINAGATVLISARTETVLKSAAEVLQCDYMVCDITDNQQITDLANATIERFGSLDIAVNCTGISAPSNTSDVSFDEANQAVQVMLLGTLFFIQAMGQAMTASESSTPSIVTISSITASSPAVGNVAYLGAKAGADHIVRSAALEFGSRNIKVNSVSPGFTAGTPMANEYLQVPGLRETFEKEIPLGRLNTATDVAHAVVWLCDDDAYITGQNIKIDGGNSLSRLPNAAEMAALFS